ncbi:MAG TPA: GNAT family N-acetyltransferase [Actinocrinis sp.]|nr:GNAT family N-acetyltransferase [Actinocrinis sp.]
MTGISTVQRLTADELHAVAPDDVMVISETRGGAIAAWSLGGGLAFAAKDDYSGAACWLSVVGEPEVAPMLVDAALVDLGDQIAGVTVPRGVDLARWNADPEPGHETDSDWDLMATWTPPPAEPAESLVVALDDRAQVQAFLNRVNPHHSVRADYERVEHWAGVRDETSGALLAVGALTRRLSGVAYLASIATDPMARGRGFGGAVTAALTRLAFERGERMCTLAHYHPNDSARRMYLRLGYQTTHRFSSGGLRQRSESSR